MKMKNMWKRFWTLDVHNHAGFTLVELIIVIAILAILSTGAIAGYSAYITSANKTADQAMIAEIKNVLTLKAYSEGVSNADFVILKLDGDAQVGVKGGFAEQALIDAYGSNWKSALSLKSNDWMAGAFLVNLDDAALIAGSTFLTTATPDGLMNAVTNLTGAAATFITGYKGDVNQGLQAVLGDKYESFKETLDNTGIDPTTDPDAYNTAISNLLVGHFADTMSGMDQGTAEADDLTGLVLTYATLYAYCETKGDTSKMDEVNEYLAGATDDGSRLNSESLGGFIETFGEDFNAGYGEYLNEQGGDDVAATLKILGAVSEISSNYTDANSLSNPKLYSSDAVSEQLNSYVDAIKAVADMDSSAIEALRNLDADAVAVVITVALDGTVA